MQDRTFHGTRARDRQNPHSPPWTRSGSDAEHSLRPSRKPSGIPESRRRCASCSRNSTPSTGSASRHAMRTPDTAPCEPDRRHWDAPDPTFRITNGTSFDDLPLAQVAFALASSRDSRTGPGSTRISLHGKRFYDHARCVLGRGAVELVCHWFNCNPRMPSGSSNR